jgi:transposase-like protein
MTTTRKKHKAKLLAVEAVAGDRDLMKALMKEALQEILEGEMTECLGAAPGERTEGRTGYRAGYYSRNLITRVSSAPMVSIKCGKERPSRSSRHTTRVSPSRT